MRIWNFVAGPSTLPESVIKKAQNDLWDVGMGAGICEISHRSDFFDHLMYDLEAQFRRIGNISDNFAVLFMQGGATLQFCQIPMAFTRPGDTIDCIHTGFWTRNAMRDAIHYANIHYAYDGASDHFQHIPQNHQIKYSDHPRYVYYCANNSFLGTEFQKPPASPFPLIADMSSNIYSRPIDVEPHSLIFASTQKNLGIAGACVLIIRRDFLESQNPNLPSLFNYQRIAQNRSMLNTPPVFVLYIMKGMLDWIEARGGLQKIHEHNIKKAKIIRDAIDSTDGFFSHVGAPGSRSLMNISFRSPSDELDAKFVREACENHMLGLKGHRETGGLRASVFNACPLDACLTLSQFIRDFAQKNG